MFFAYLAVDCYLSTDDVSSIDLSSTACKFDCDHYLSTDRDMNDNIDVGVKTSRMLRGLSVDRNSIRELALVHLCKRNYCICNFDSLH